MIFISILIFILAMSLPSLKTQITPIFFTRITSVVFIYAAALSFNAVHIHAIGSGIGLYGGLFHVSYYNVLIETFFYIIAAVILLSWPLFNKVEKFSYLEVLDKRNVNSTYPLYLETLSKTSSTVRRSSISTSVKAREYSLLVLFSTLGGSFLLSSGDFLSMYLSIELQSFSLYILATIYRESGSATSAGLKYFLLGGLSSCLILLGVAIIYSFTGLTNFDSVYTLLSVMNYGSDSVINLSSLLHTRFVTSFVLEPTYYSSFTLGLSLGLILIVVGFLFKIAGAPFHNWAPDVYDDSPTNVTAWLTIVPKISIILFLLDVVMSLFINSSVSVLDISSPGPGIGIGIGIGGGGAADAYLQQNIIRGDSLLKNIFLLSSLLSLIIGSVVGLAQIRIKRLLAYSTISHIGFLLLSLALSSEQSIESLIFYLMQYTLSNLNTFLILLAFGYIINSVMLNTYINSDIKFIYTLRGQFISNPILSLSLVVCLFSMAGIPPLIGFFGKQSVLYAAISNGFYFISFVAIVSSVISASYYLRLIRELYSDSDKKDKERLDVTSTLSKMNLKSNINLVSDTELLDVVEGKIKVLDELDLRITSLNAFTNSSGLLKESVGARYARNMLPYEDKNVPNAASFTRYNRTYLSLSNIHSFMISSLSLSILFYVVKPSILLNSAVLSTLFLFST